MITDKSHAVLIVEDERIVAKDLQETLAGMGYDAFAVASSAEEALARASEKCPDVVLMDIRIKGKRDGIDTATILRRSYDVPVVYLTAHADDATIERAKRTEPYGYLLKPVKPAELRSAIEVSLYRHQMEKRLRERERWFSTTLRSIADAVITVDLGGKITFMNPAAEALTGTKVADGVGRPAREVIRLLDDKAEVRGETPLDHALERRESLELREAGLLGESSASRVISDSAAPVMDDGELLGAVMVFRDITEQKLLQRQAELSDRLSSLGTMAAGVAHEVNNPLAVVVANSSFVLDEMRRLQAALSATKDVPQQLVASLEEAVEAQTELRVAASRIGRIVSDLKAFSRPNPETSEGADIGRAIEWAVRSTAHEFRYRARVNTHVAEVPRAKLDETRLGQILVNLLINAAHAIAPGRLDDNQVTILAKTDGDHRIVIEISDTGCGMAPAVLNRVFEPFFTTKSVNLGTGLGLSICHGIVSAVGGEIRAQSVEGKGSTFRVLLPAVSAKQLPPPPAQALPRESALRGRILIIDDENLVLRALERMLRDHEVVCRGSAREALDLLERGEKFDLILLDVMMPTMTGIELYETVLERSPDLARRIVFMSGGTINAKVEDFLRSVPNLRIEKPFGVVRMLGTVQELLAR